MVLLCSAFSLQLPLCLSMAARDILTPNKMTPNKSPLRFLSRPYALTGTQNSFTHSAACFTCSSVKCG
jgi:hypothetical protein